MIALFHAGNSRCTDVHGHVNDHAVGYIIFDWKVFRGIFSASLMMQGMDAAFESLFKQGKRLRFLNFLLTGYFAVSLVDIRCGSVGWDTNTIPGRNG